MVLPRRVQNGPCKKSCEIQRGGQEMTVMVVEWQKFNYVNFVHRFT